MNDIAKNKGKDDPTKKLVVETLAEQLGVDTDEINDDDSFSEDLHMSPSDFTEFISKLEESGIEISEVDISEVETLSELLENIALNQPL